MNINFDFQDLQAFISVADHTSFQQASAQLNLSQPALTRRIQKLEKTLGVVLLERSTRSVNLTLAGKNFRARAEVMLEEANEAVMALRDHEQQFEYQRKTVITIALIPTVTRRIVMDALHTFRQQGHSARIRLMDGNANEVAEAVAQDTADFGLSFIPVNEPGLSFEPLIEDQFALVMRKGDPLYSETPIHWSAIDSSRLILPWKGTGNRMLIDDALARSGTTLNWAFEVTRSATVLDMVASGVGIAVLPQSVGRLMIVLSWLSGHWWSHRLFGHWGLFSDRDIHCRPPLKNCCLFRGYMHKYIDEPHDILRLWDSCLIA